jgi:hypothetical protein
VRILKKDDHDLHAEPVFLFLRSLQIIGRNLLDEEAGSGN